jgi:hypothetical protein
LLVAVRRSLLVLLGLIGLGLLLLLLCGIWWRLVVVWLELRLRRRVLVCSLLLARQFIRGRSDVALLLRGRCAHVVFCCCHILQGCPRCRNRCITRIVGQASAIICPSDVVGEIRQGGLAALPTTSRFSHLALFGGAYAPTYVIMSFLRSCEHCLHRIGPRGEPWLRSTHAGCRSPMDTASTACALADLQACRTIHHGSVKRNPPLKVKTRRLAQTVM